MSENNLVRHAEYEMRRAGLYGEDSDYGGMIPEAVMKLVRVLAEDGHSGGSHAITMAVFRRVANFKALTPLTNDPGEWNEVGASTWQNRRDSSWFSTDGGKTGYSIKDEPPRVTKPMAEATQAYK